MSVKHFCDFCGEQVKDVRDLHKITIKFAENPVPNFEDDEEELMQDICVECLGFLGGKLSKQKGDEPPKN